MGAPVTLAPLVNIFFAMNHSVGRSTTLSLTSIKTSSTCRSPRAGSNRSGHLITEGISDDTVESQETISGRNAARGRKPPRCLSAYWAVRLETTLAFVTGGGFHLPVSASDFGA